MDRKYFFELGAYDPGMLIWGGENYELSFKVCTNFSLYQLLNRSSYKVLIWLITQGNKILTFFCPMN